MDMIWMAAIALVPIALLVTHLTQAQAAQRRAVRVKAVAQGKQRR